MGATSTHFCFTSRDLPRQGSLPAVCDSLPHFLLLHPPPDCLKYLLHTRPGSLPFAIMPLPRFLLPSREFPRKVSFPAACNSLPNFLLLLPPWDHLPFPIAYLIMLPALCDRDLAALSSAHAASNALSSVLVHSKCSLAPSNSLSPCDNSAAPSAASFPESSLLSWLISLFALPLIFSCF